MPLMVCVRDDWYRRHHKPKPLLMKQLSGKMRLLSDTMCRFFFFCSGSPHSKHDEKAQTRLWQLWDSSITHTFLPHLKRAHKNFEVLSRDSAGAADRVSASQKSWNFLAYSSHFTRPAVSGSEIQSFECVCGGYSPMTGLPLREFY